MALTVALGAVSTPTTSALGSQTTELFTPPASALILLCGQAQEADISGTQTCVFKTPTDTASLSWTSVDSRSGTSFLLNDRWQVISQVWQATAGGSPSSMTATTDWDVGGTDYTSSGPACGTVTVTGHDAASPIVQVKSVSEGFAVTDLPPSLAVTLDSAPTTGNALIVFAHHGVKSPSNKVGMSTAYAGTGNTFTSLFNNSASDAAAHWGGIYLAYRIVASGDSSTVTIDDSGDSLGHHGLHVIEVKLSPSATVTPTTIAAVAALPARTVSAGSTVTPTTIAAVTAMPAGAVSAGSTVTPTTITATAALPSRTVSTGSTVTPTAITVVAALPSRTVSTGSTVTPTTITSTSTLHAPAVTAGSGVTVLAGTIVASTAMPAAAFSAGATVTATRIETVAAMPLATVTLPALITPAVILATTALPEPGLQAGSTILAAHIACPTVFHVPDVRMSVGMIVGRTESTSGTISGRKVPAG